MATIDGDEDPNTLDGTPDPDTIHGGGGGDTIHGWGAGDLIYGDDGDDALFGDDGDDSIYGGVGSDFISGGTGADTMVGGIGNDRYDVDSLDDMVTEAADEGFDAVRTTVSGYKLPYYVEQLTLLGTTAVGKGNYLANRIFGNDADNTLRGMGGADRLYGGNGNDLYQVFGMEETVIESSASGGFDTVYSAGNFILGANVEVLVLTGMANAFGTGNELDNTIKGDDSNNLIDGGLGADTMKGGRGQDIYIVDNVGDVVIEYAEGGGDTVKSSISYSLLGNHVENVTLTGMAAINATGNSLRNELIGNDAANVLDGREGADWMTGGGGDDTYYIDNAGDSLTEEIGGGYDTVVSSVTFAFTPDGWSPEHRRFEALVLTGFDAIDGTGNELDNKITGNGAANVLKGLGGNDILDGGAGADSLYGGKGDDIYYIDNVGDKAREGNEVGIDAVYASVSYDLAGEFIESLTLTGDNAINASGNSLANVIRGNAGANTIDGRGGADTMIGGGGNDTYVVDDAGDKVVEASGGGTDRVLSAVSYSLAGIYVEKLTLTGAGVTDATGNSLANELTGNDAANVLRGEDGADSLYGKGGNDILSGGAGADRFYFDTALGAGNVDTIGSFSAADDTIMLSRTIFSGIGSDGTIAAGAFVNGTAAADADDRILYDSATGKIFYDADGSGAGAAMLFAQVAAGTALTNVDFSAYMPG
ncbi:MAG TPA: hypothetical protein VFQ67_05460 [Allosphingosinicella sp.]|jgi:Ca2+-binding RTX toxin-like protein|nr:hypothetical protein [Allosphingosinicella sp.]